MPRAGGTAADDALHRGNALHAFLEHTLSTPSSVPPRRRGATGLLLRLAQPVAARRRRTRARSELAEALAGHHGPGVQAEVRAALRRQAA